MSIRPKISARTFTAIGLIVAMLLGVGFYFSYGSGIRTGHVQYEQDMIIKSQLNELLQEARGKLDKSEKNAVFAQR